MVFSNVKGLIFIMFAVIMFASVGIPAISREYHYTVQKSASQDDYVTTGTYDVSDIADINVISGDQLLGMVCAATNKNCLGTIVENSRILTNVPLNNQTDSDFVLYVDGMKIDQTVSTKTISFAQVPSHKYKLSYGKDSTTGKLVIHANNI